MRKREEPGPKRKHRANSRVEIPRAKIGGGIVGGAGNA